MKLTSAAMLAVSAIALSGCAIGLPTQVSRFQSMPAPQGQSFAVVPANPRNDGLQFARYASLVAQAMQAQGYAPAASPDLATMLVSVDYGVDRGTQEYVEDPFYESPFGGYGSPYYSRYGYYGARSPYYYGWGSRYGSRYNSPFGYGDPFGRSGSLTRVYQSFLDLDIRRRSDRAPLFEGHAKARSSTDNLGTLVPNLVTAMFTGFPGQSGETIRITVPPQRRAY
ncbi:MAG: DUF4136 domain-containing protein [Sphingomicrobium sp.]